MKPAPFKYLAPATIEETVDYMEEHGYDAKLLAGGQSLIPMMNFRLVQPEVLVDLNNISRLSYVRLDNNGRIKIGAMTRHYQAERDAMVAEHLPLLYETMPHIATAQIRSRGTFGGSIAHADPSAELAAVSIALDGEFRLVSNRGERWVKADEFFVGMFTTVLEPDEVLVEARFSKMAERTGWAIHEVARRPHDFAMVGVTASLTLDKRNKIQDARLVFLSVGEYPIRGVQAEGILRGQEPSEKVFAAASDTAASQDTDPSSDIHASSDFRRHLVRVLAQRALRTSLERAKNNGR
jgi:CO/xanthine dehydrogenase FAD-binding subunit